MVVEKGFKQTEIGVIPEDWEIDSLGDLFKFKQGVQVPVELQFQDESDNRVRFIRIVDVTQKDELPRFINNPGNNHIVSFGELFMVRYGAAGLVSDSFNGVIANNLFRLLPKCEIVNKYFYYLLQFKYHEIVVLSTSTTMSALSFGSLADLKLSYPITKTEQIAIATALSDMDALITQTEKLIEKKNAIKQGVMQELLRPKEGWVTKKFTDVVEYIHGKAHEQYIVDDGKYKVVNSKFISTDGEIVKYSNVSFLTAKKDDILTVLSDLPNGKALAKCFLVDQDNLYAVNQRVCIWRSKVANPLFLFYLLNRHKYFLQLDDGVTQTHILNGDINRFEITITEDVESQKQIGIIIHDIDKEISQLEKKSLKLKLQKQGMMQALLTGKIRLV